MGRSEARNPLSSQEPFCACWIALSCQPEHNEKAGLAESGSEEYACTLALKGQDPDKLQGLHFALNLIKATLWETEVLWSRFEPLGYGVKQMYRFDEPAGTSNDGKRRNW